MDLLSEKIADIDLPAILEGEGIRLRRSGRGYLFLCPFHTDKHPSGSLYINSGRWRWKCFGCGAGGDVVDFIQKRHGLNFQGACRYLGIEFGPLSPKQIANIQNNKQRRKISDAFRAWELEAIDDLRRMVFMVYRITAGWKNEDDMDQGADWLHCLPDLQGQIDTLMTVSLADRVGIYYRYASNGYRY